MVPSGANPTSIAQATRMEKSLKAPEKPAEAPSKPKATPTPKKSTKAPSASPRPSQRPSAGRPRNSQDVAGDPRKFKSPVGASNPPTQGNTSNAGKAYEEGKGAASKGRVNYKGHQSMYDRAAKANDGQLSTRSRDFSRGRHNVRNASAVREMTRRDNLVAEARGRGRGRGRQD
jgi:hypothetical protein